MVHLLEQFSAEVVYLFFGACAVVLSIVLTSFFWHRKLRAIRNINELVNLDLEQSIRVVKQENESLQHQHQTLDKELAVAQSQLQQLAPLNEKLEQQHQELLSVNRENVMLKTRIDSERLRYEEQLELLKNAKDSLGKEFENIANKIFEAKQSQFTQSSRTALEGTVNPLREQLKDFRKQVEDVYNKENADRNKLAGQITELQKQTQQIGQDAINLASALKGNNKTQGNWGEVVLERLLEESGLRKGHEYETQVSLKDDQGQRRNPDVIVRLPEQKDIVIDAKVSLLHYEQYCNADIDNEKQQALKGHLTSIRGHIDLLSKKNYERLDNIRSLDFVFIFVPVESAFMLALEHDPQLFSYAYDKHIVLVSPTTLLATLRTVENIWRYEKQNKNAERIAAMAGKLHDQFVLVVQSLQELGQNIVKTQQSFDNTQKRLQTGNGNLYKRIQDLDKLGAKSKRRLPKNDLISDGEDVTKLIQLNSLSEPQIEDELDEIEEQSPETEMEAETASTSTETD
ncbi:DNA recombination protein RmuC [Aurantivibrio infirmus]